MDETHPEVTEESTKDELPPMQALATFTGGVWSHVFPPEGDEDAKGCKDDLHSSLVEFMRSDNLVVLTGLGTSLCVTDEKGNKPAPKMSDLWNAVRGAVGVGDFERMLTSVRHPEGDQNIELLLSRCQTAQAF